MRRILSIAAIIAAVSLSACGGSSHKRADAAAELTPAEISCTLPAPTAIATRLHVSAKAIGESASVGNNGMPQCMFPARLASGTTVEALVNVDNGPSPYFRLLRTENEDAQGFPKLDHAPPSAIVNLGLEADWFPQYPQLMTTDGYRLITVAVTWRHERQRDERTLAIAMARPFLHTPHWGGREPGRKGLPIVSRFRQVSGLAFRALRVTDRLPDVVLWLGCQPVWRPGFGGGEVEGGLH
jgi:hypothetical protein